MTEEKAMVYTSSNELLDSIFENELSKSNLYDQEIVALVKKHLANSSIHSRAGNNLAKELIALAQHRVEEGEK